MIRPAFLSVRHFVPALLFASFAFRSMPARAQISSSVKSSSDKAIEELDREAAKASASPNEEPKSKPAEKTVPAPEPVPAPADPFQKGLDDAQKVLGAVGDGKEAIEKLHEAFDKAAESVKNSKYSAPDKERFLKQIEQADEALAAHTKLYARFADHAGKVKDALDLINEVKELKSTMDDYSANQGRGAANLEAFMFLAQKLGGEVPFLGAAVSAYAEITRGILKATNQLSQSINDGRRQGALGAEGQRTGEKFEALKAGLGEKAAQAHTWLPTEPGWIYTDIDGRAPDLIWDAEAKSWLQVSPGGAESIYWKNRLAGKTPAPQFLVALCQPETVLKAQEREKAAQKYLALLSRCSRGLGDEYLTYLAVNQKSGWALREWLRDPTVFAARYTYDGLFKAEAQAAFKTLYAELVKKLPADSPLLADMRDWAKTQELVLTASPEEKPEPCWQSDYDRHKQAVDWLPRIHDKNSFAHWSCDPQHSAQETPAKPCCDTYYGTRNNKGMWEAAWSNLQDCGWAAEIEKRRQALEKAKAACAAKPAKH